MDNLWERYRLLSPREKEVMEKIVDGKMNKVIAYELNVSMKTVELHRSNLMHKMMANSLAELVKMHCSMQMKVDFLC